MSLSIFGVMRAARDSTSRCERRSTIRTFGERVLAIVVVAAVLGCEFAAANGEGFISLNISNATEFLDVTVVDPNTLTPLPPNFFADDDGVYALTADLVLNGDTANPIGSIEVNGNETGQFEFVAELSVVGGADNGLAFFAGLIVGIEMEDIDNEEVRRLVDAKLSARANGVAGTPPANAGVGWNVFVETTDDFETRVNDASQFVPLPIPGITGFESGPVALPPIPEGSQATAYNVLVGQLDVSVFGISPNSDFVVNATSSAAISPPVPDGDCDGDGAITASDLACVRSIQERDNVLNEANLLRGDFDLDGKVEFSDFLRISGNYNQPGSYFDGDFDVSGTVDFSDFVSWTPLFGTSAGQAAVPEPTGLILLGMGAMSTSLMRRRSRVCPRD